MAFARHIHAWFDRGVWSLKVKTRDNSSHENKVIFYWLPDGFNDKELFPNKVELDDDNYNSIRLIWATLENARRLHFLPREPLKGSGHIIAHLCPTHEILKTGHVFTIQHADADEAKVFYDMISLHWRCMYLQMLRGVGQRSDEGGNEGDNKDGGDKNDDTGGKARRVTRSMKRARMSTDSDSAPTKPVLRSSRGPGSRGGRGGGGSGGRGGVVS